jgi:DNA primase
MAKVSPVSIKYMIHASFKAEGPLEKPDVIGALFGQTEGLLGSDLEMRELQKEGRIGRIEVELETVDGKSIGEIEVPSALDKSETTIIAAALETIDRIGPTEADIKVTKIEDVRGSKRDFIVDRAKQLLAGIEGDGEIGEMSKALKEESRAEKIQEYGEERLPAGDLNVEEIIVVEGRADVVNLLKNRVNNVIGMNGTKLPREIAKLGESKELTLFVDGDRGGKLIAKNVIDNAKIQSVAVAPDGKEVEELTGKEIIVALRRKVSAREFLGRNGYSSNGGGDRRGAREDKPSHDDGKENRANETSPKFSPSDARDEVKKAYEKVKGSKAALLLNNELDIIKKVGAREVTRNLRSGNGEIYGVVIDGAATANVIKACDEESVKYLGATNFSSVDGAKVELISL